MYVRYIYNGDFKEEFLFCQALETTTTAKDICDKVGSFLGLQGFKWKNVHGVCTDGAPAMLGCRSGFQKRVKLMSTRINLRVHCMIHRQVLA